MLQFFHPSGSHLLALAAAAAAVRVQMMEKAQQEAQQRAQVVQNLRQVFLGGEDEEGLLGASAGAVQDIGPLAQAPPKPRPDARIVQGARATTWEAKFGWEEENRDLPRALQHKEVGPTQGVSAVASHRAALARASSPPLPGLPGWGTPKVEQLPGPLGQGQGVKAREQELEEGELLGGSESASSAEGQSPSRAGDSDSSRSSHETSPTSRQKQGRAHRHMRCREPGSPRRKRRKRSRSRSRRKRSRSRDHGQRQPKRLELRVRETDGQLGPKGPAPQAGPTLVHVAAKPQLSALPTDKSGAGAGAAEAGQDMRSRLRALLGQVL